MTTKENFNCPLCSENTIVYIEKKKNKPLTKWSGSDSTHIYSCSECPFVALEYFDKSDLLLLNEYLQ